MIKTFADEDTRKFWETSKSRRRPPASLVKVAKRKLLMIDAAGKLDDLKVPPGNKLHSLKRERSHQHAIWINEQFRVCFTWKDGNAYDVEITDYHDD